MKKSRKIFNEEERIEILKKTGYKCAHCGRTIDLDSMTVEHIFPFSKGGDDSEYNLTALCKECNNEKSNFVYDIPTYYKYILEEHRMNYMMNFIRMKNKLIDTEELIGFGNMGYLVQTPENMRKVFAAMQRGSKKGKESAIRFFENTAIRLSLDKAYPAQAEDIAKFCEKLHNKTGEPIGNYNNEYVIMDHMRKGRVLTLCNKLGEIFGVLVFVHVKYINLDSIQLQNLCENTGLQPVYVMTLAVFNDRAEQCANEIMSDFFLQFMDRKCIALYFSERYEYLNSEEAEVIRLPMELDNMQGYLHFYTLKGMKHLLRESMKGNIERGYSSEDEVEKMIEQTFDPNVTCSDWGNKQCKEEQQTNE